MRCTHVRAAFISPTSGGCAHARHAELSHTSVKTAVAVMSQGLPPAVHHMGYSRRTADRTYGLYVQERGVCCVSGSCPGVDRENCHVGLGSMACPWALARRVKYRSTLGPSPELCMLDGLFGPRGCMPLSACILHRTLENKANSHSVHLAPGAGRWIVGSIAYGLPGEGVCETQTVAWRSCGSTGARG